MRKKFIVVILATLLGFTAQGRSEEKGPGSQVPAPVEVLEIRSGRMPPHGRYVGTVFYSEVSDVATEVSGIVERILVEEGQRVKKGDVFAKLNADIMNKKREATKAAYEQSIAELEKAALDLSRIENLYNRKSVAQQLYDEHRFRVKSLEKKVQALKAETEGLAVEVEKKVIRAPFQGIVIRRFVDRGEWLSQGQPVATLARDDMLEVVVDVPERVVRFIRRGHEVIVEAGGKQREGEVLTLIPQGDVATRTFPVKIRIPNDGSLMEGMEAQVTLPEGENRAVFVVSRDAIVSGFGTDRIFTVADSVASALPVNVIGYQGNMAGIEGQGLKQGLKAVVKGNERLRDGQPVRILNSMDGSIH